MPNRKTLIIVSVLVAVVVVGVVAVWYYWYTIEQIPFDFELSPSSMPDAVALYVFLDAGDVNIHFEEDASLLYRIHLATNRWEIQQAGDPTVIHVANEIDLTYTAASADITLGSGTRYIIEVGTLTGDIQLTMGAGAHIGNVTIEDFAGNIDLVMTNEVAILEDVTIDLEVVDTGNIDVDIHLPSGAGGSFAATNGVENIDITTSTWTQVNTNDYETADYGTAEITVTITADDDTGNIVANLH